MLQPSDRVQLGVMDTSAFGLQEKILWEKLSRMLIFDVAQARLFFAVNRNPSMMEDGNVCGPFLLVVLAATVVGNVAIVLGIDRIPRFTC